MFPHLVESLGVVKRVLLNAGEKQGELLVAICCVGEILHVKVAVGEEGQRCAGLKCI